MRASVFAEIGLFEEWPRAADSELVHRLAARRPDLRARDRARRPRLYTQTNARIPTFRELGAGARLAVLARLVLGSRGRSE